MKGAATFCFVVYGLEDLQEARLCQLGEEEETFGRRLAAEGRGKGEGDHRGVLKCLQGPQRCLLTREEKWVGCCGLIISDSDELCRGAEPCPVIEWKGCNPPVKQDPGKCLIPSYARQGGRASL